MSKEALVLLVFSFVMAPLALALVFAGVSVAVIAFRRLRGVLNGDNSWTSF